MASLSTVVLTVIVELATINLADGKTEADLIEASNIFQKEFLDHQSGFIRRELVRNSNGGYVDIVHWESQEDVDAVMKIIESSPAVHQYFSVMKFDPENPNEGVEHNSSMVVYEAPNR